MVKNFINFYQNQFGELILNNFKERVCMQNTITGLFVTFVVLFSLQGFSQTTEKSAHPLLDKYYPQKQNTDTNKTITTQIKPVPEIKPVPVPETKPAPALPTTPVVTTKTVPAVTTMSNVTTTPAVTTIPVVTTTPVLNKQDTVTAQVPVQKKIQPQPKPKPYTPYMDTRLGSSSPLYDTWEKNSNGAGSVTTSPK